MSKVVHYVENIAEWVLFQLFLLLFYLSSILTAQTFILWLLLPYFGRHVKLLALKLSSTEDLTLIWVPGLAKNQLHSSLAS